MKDIVGELESLSRSRWPRRERIGRVCIAAQTEIMLLRKRVLLLESTYDPEYRMLNSASGLVDPHWEDR